LEVFALFTHPESGGYGNVFYSLFRNNDGTWSDFNPVTYDFNGVGIGPRFDVATRQDGGTELIFRGSEKSGTNYYLQRAYRVPPESNWNNDGSDWTTGRFVAGTNGYVLIKDTYKDKNRVSFQLNTVVNYLTVFAPDNISTTEKKFNYSSWTPAGNWATFIPLR